MNYTQADHVWFIERIEAYLGGDLAGDELARFESHAAACLPCEAKLGEGSRADAALRELFAAHRPAAGLEDRAIVAVRTSLDQHRPRLLLNPKVRRAARVAAAALVVAAMGYVGKLALDGGSLSRFNPGRLFVMSPKDVVSRVRSAGSERFDARAGNAGGSLADGMASVLRRRVEPTSTRNLTWREDSSKSGKDGFVSLDVKSQAQTLGEDRLLTRVNVDPIAQAQTQIRNGKYQEALGTIDEILKTDPNNDYARGVRPLVQDKAALALSRHGEFDEKMERSLTEAEEKRIPYEDLMRYPANWPDISEVREKEAKQEVAGLGWGESRGRGDAALQSTNLGREVHGGRQVSEDRGTFSGPVAGTAHFGFQLKDGLGVDKEKLADSTVAHSTSYVLDTDSKKSGGKSAGVSDEMADNQTLRRASIDHYYAEKEVSRKSLVLLTDGRAGDSNDPAVASGALLDLNGMSSTVQLGTTAGITKAGSGSLVVNGENSFTGATTVTGGAVVAGKPALARNDTLTFTHNAMAGVPGSIGSAPPSNEYAYIDPVKAPQPAEAKHVKLQEVATDWGMHTDLGDKDGDGGSATRGFKMKLTTLAFGRGSEHEGRAKTESEKLELPGLKSMDDKEKPVEAKLAEVNVEDKVKQEVAAGGDPVPTLYIRAAREPAKAGDVNRAATDFAMRTGRTESADQKGKARVYDVEDLNTRVPDSINRADAVALANQTPATTGAATPSPSTGIPPLDPLAATQPAALAPVQRKIIRNGDVIFEVDSFDSAYMQIGKIVAEEGGYIGTTDSEKLPNGKVKGTVTVRVPPERLDILILKLRGLGDLKNQKIAAQDVTKQFVDSESQLKADRYMEERLLNLIKTGKGEVKELVAAEKELGNYREKIEQLEGELRYLQSQVSLSTLNITLFERDIKTPTAAFEAETIDTAIETEEVEKARADAIKSVEDAKGRIVESQMKRFEAGQLQATIVAEVAPENAGPVIDRLKQLGHVARFDVERKQTTQGGQGAPVGLKLEKRATVFKVSIYNLANIAPRETVNVSLAAEDVEKAYKAILAAAEVEEQVNGVAVKVGRVVSSSLNSQRADQTTGNITIEVRADRAAVVEAAIRSAGGTGGEVMHMTVTENPDANNVTRAKRGYVVTLASLSSVAPRETAVLSVAAKDVPALYQTLMAQLQEGKDGKGRGKVYASRLEEQDRQNVEAFVDFEIPRGESANIEALLNSGTTSDVFRRNVTRSPDVTSTLDSKVRMQVSILNVGRLRPREESAFTIEVENPEAALLTVQGIATAAGGRMYEPHLNKDESGKVEGEVAFDVPLSAAAATADKLRALGTVRQSRSLTNESVPAGTLAKARFDVTVMNPKQLVAANHGVGARIREGVGTSLDALLLLLEWVIVVAPFVLVLWLLWKLFRRGRKMPAVTAKPAAV